MKAQALEQWRETTDKRAVAAGVLGFAGSRIMVMPMPTHPVLAQPRNVGLKDLGEGTFDEGLDKASNFNASLLDTTLRLETAPLLIALHAPAVVAITGGLSALGGAAAGASVSAGYTALTSKSTGFDFVNDLHASYVSAYFSGVLTAGAGEIVPANALRLSRPMLAARLGIQAGGGVIGYGMNQALTGGKFTVGGAVASAVTSTVGGETGRALVPPNSSIGPVASDATAAFLGGAADQAVSGAVNELGSHSDL